MARRPRGAAGRMEHMRRVKHTALAIFTLVLAGCNQQASQGARGQVSITGGKPAASTAVTMTEADSGIQHTVFTGPDGKYQFAQSAAAGWKIAVALPGMTPLDRDFDDARKAQDFTLAADPEGWRRSTSDNWLGMLPDGMMRRELILNCTTCHVIAAERIAPDGKARDEAGWRAAIAYMRSLDIYKVVPPDFDDARYAKWLAAAWNPNTIRSVPLPKPIDRKSVV